MPGHVVIITDLARHEITEADGYESSFGKVQTIKLSTFFRNMSSWQDLLNAYHEQKIVTRLDAAGHDFKKSTIKIFKLTQDQA